MCEIAIKEHKTRGAEVIELLEMLGGKNIYKLTGNDCAYYVIEHSEIRIGEYIFGNEPYRFFTLEEFLEKFPYKVGDKVTLDKYPCVITGMNWDCDDIIYYVKGADFSKGVYSKDKDLQPYKKETIEKSIDKTNKVIFETNAQSCDIRNEIIKKDMEEIEIALVPFKVGDKVIVKGYEKMGEDEIIYIFKTYDGDIKYKTKNHLDTHYFMEDSLMKVGESNKEETMEEKGDKAKAPVLTGEDYSGKRFGYKIPNGYEFDCIKNNEIILTPKQTEYPKTYKECCDVLGLSTMDNDAQGYEADLIIRFQELLISRDAYWKIAGEQMGLGKLWKSDFTNDDEERYGIYTLANKVEKDFCGVGDVNMILVFPTEEMRDAFFENFKDLIEQCKELL